MRKLSVFILLWFLFWGNLSFLPLVSSIDEILGIFSYMYVVVCWKRLSLYERRLIALCFILLFFGVVGNFIHGYLTAIFPIGLDFLQCTKVFVVFVAANHFIGSLSETRKKSVLQKLVLIAGLYIIVAFCCAIVNFFVNIGMSADVRMGFRCFKFYYGNAGGFANSLYLIIFIFLAYGRFFRSKRLLKVLLFMSMVSWALTFRSRGFLFILIFLLLYYLIVVKKKELKVKVWSVIVLVLFSLYVTADQIDVYFNNENMPRAILLHNGIQTMTRFFPIGAGFGTYGTDVAVKYYSNLYKELGLDERWGFTPDNPVFALDSYWPAVFGQFGAIGVLIFLSMLYCWYKLIQKNKKRDAYCNLAALFIIITQVFSSIATSVFFSPNTVALFFFLPLLNESYNSYSTFDNQKKIGNV